MQVTTPTDRYGVPTQALHWLGALAILAAWSLGIMLESFPRGPVRAEAMGVHTLLGTAVLTLAALRVFSRLAGPTPAATGPAWRERAARLAHAGLYALTVALPLTGLLARWARSGSAAMPFGWSIPAPFPIPATKFWGETHETLAFALAALVVAHVAAALWHRLVLRDGVMQRMVPALGR